MTKFGMNYRDKPNLRDSSRERVIASIDKSLKNLGTDYVDVYLVHWPDRETPFEETMSALDDIVREGKVRFVGLSNFKREEIEACMAVRRVDVVQYGWNMFDRRMQREILPYCAENGVGFMAYGSLAFGLLTGTFTEDHDFGSADWRSRQGNMGAIKMFAALFGPEKFKDNVRAVEELKDIAARYGKSLPQLALRWAISHPAVSTALVGCRTVAEVEDNVGAVGWSISDADLAEIDAIFARHDDRHHARLLDRRGVRVGSRRARGEGCDRHRGRERVGARDGRAASSRRARTSSSPTSTARAARRSPEQLGAAAAFQPTDVADADQVQAVVDFAVERFGGLHVMCNNAGIGGSFKRFLDDDFADFDRVMAVNIFGVMVGSQRAARHMADARRRRDRQHDVDRRDQRRRGRDGVPRHEGGGHPPHPVDRGRARAHYGIRVNCIAPAHIPTAINAALDQSLIVRAMQPLQRVGSPRDVAEAVALPRERPGRADHRGRAARRRRHDRRFAAPLDQGPHGRAARAEAEVRHGYRRTRIYSCDDHLDLYGRAARRVGVAAAARAGRARARGS